MSDFDQPAGSPIEGSQPGFRAPWPGSRAVLSFMQRQHGGSLVEMALTFPVVLLILLSTLDLGRAVYAQNVIAYAAREGARYGAIVPTDSQAIQDRVRNSIVGVDQNAVTVAVEVLSQSVRVTVTYQFSTVTPFAGRMVGQGGMVTLRGIATMRIEASQ